MTLVPTSAWFYDQLFLWLVARTWKQSLVLSVCSWVAYVAVLAQAPIDLTDIRSARVIQAILAVGVYLPAAVMVWRQPNEGPAPVWLERRAAALPRWLRGTEPPVVLTVAVSRTRCSPSRYHVAVEVIDPASVSVTV